MKKLFATKLSTFITLSCALTVVFLVMSMINSYSSEAIYDDFTFFETFIFTLISASVIVAYLMFFVIMIRKAPLLVMVFSIVGLLLYWFLLGGNHTGFSEGNSFEEFTLFGKIFETFVVSTLGASVLTWVVLGLKLIEKR